MRGPNGHVVKACIERGRAEVLEVKRWVTIAIGAIVGVVGLVWIGQGIGVIGGSAMTGTPAFAVLGAGLVIAAVVILARAGRTADGG